MDPLNAMRQHFINRFGRAASDTELADMFLAAGIMMHETQSPPQVLSRVKQMLTPGTPLNTFVRQFK